MLIRNIEMILRSHVRSGEVGVVMMDDIPHSLALYRGEEGCGADSHILRMDVSHIPGAGTGVFANTQIPANKRIAFYDGRRIRRNEALRLRHQGFDSHIVSMRGADGDCIDGLRGDDESVDWSVRGWGSLLNDGNPNGIVNNCRFQSDERGIYCVTKRTVECGEELLVSYGNDYWSSFHHHHHSNASSQ